MTIFSKPLSILAMTLSLGLSAQAQSINTPAKQAILMDLSSGATLFERASEEAMPPSSMSKMMTVYIAFEQIAQGKLNLSDKAVVSRDAWRRWAGSEASLMFLGVGEEVTIEDLLRGIIISSGNDACTVLAEHLAGTEDGFALWMNDKAMEIGLTGSNLPMHRGGRTQNNM